jgi:hypothetical protein
LEDDDQWVVQGLDARGVGAATPASHGDRTRQGWMTQRGRALVRGGVAAARSQSTAVRVRCQCASARQDAKTWRHNLWLPCGARTGGAVGGRGVDATTRPRGAATGPERCNAVL